MHGARHLAHASSGRSGHLCMVLSLGLRLEGDLASLAVRHRVARSLFFVHICLLKGGVHRVHCRDGLCCTLVSLGSLPCHLLSRICSPGRSLHGSLGRRHARNWVFYSRGGHHIFVGLRCIGRCGCSVLTGLSRSHGSIYRASCRGERRLGCSRGLGCSLSHDCCSLGRCLGALLLELLRFFLHTFHQDGKLASPLQACPCFGGTSSCLRSLAPELFGFQFQASLHHLNLCVLLQALTSRFGAGCLDCLLCTISCVLRCCLRSGGCG